MKQQRSWSNALLWAIYLALLAVLLPHTAWAFSRFELPDNGRLGVRWGMVTAFFVQGWDPPPPTQPRSLTFCFQDGHDVLHKAHLLVAGGGPEILAHDGLGLAAGLANACRPQAASCLPISRRA